MQAFQHQSEPMPVPMKRQRPKYRTDADDDDVAASNIMFDRRVVRGNTYAAQVITQAQQREIERLRAEDERRRQAELLRRKRGQKRRPTTPPPVPGRAHTDVQTEEFVEKLSDRNPVVDGCTQTDGEMDAPIPVLFMPKKSGVDKETQVEDGELFDFDFEVAPVLEVLVCKTMENAMMEIMEQCELEAILAQQKEFESRRDAELAEVQRLEAQIRRRAEEKQRRLDQKKALQRELVAMKEEVESRSIAQGYMRDLQDRVFETMQDAGLFFDPLVREIETTFLPWLLDSTAKKVDEVQLSQEVAISLVQDSLAKAKQQTKTFRKELDDIKEAREEQLRRELEEQKRLEEEREAERRRQEEEEAKAEENAEGEED